MQWNLHKNSKTTWFGERPGWWTHWGWGTRRGLCPERPWKLCPSPQYLALYISSIWLSPSWNKLVIVSKALSRGLWIVLVNYWTVAEGRGCDGNPWICSLTEKNVGALGTSFMIYSKVGEVLLDGAPKPEESDSVPELAVVRRKNTPELNIY